MSKTIHSFLKPATFPDQENSTVTFFDIQLITKVWSYVPNQLILILLTIIVAIQPSPSLSYNMQGPFCYYHSIIQNKSQSGEVTSLLANLLKLPCAQRIILVPLLGITGSLRYFPDFSPAALYH